MKHKSTFQIQQNYGQSLTDKKIEFWTDHPNVWLRTCLCLVWCTFGLNHIEKISEILIHKVYDNRK